MPRDLFRSGYLSNATGSVGIIVAPRTNASIFDVCHTDVGSSMGRIVRDITVQDCDNTITQRVQYNEWAIVDYEVLGLFVMDPLQVVGIQKVPNPFGGMDYTPAPTDADLTSLPSSLSVLPVFTFSAGLIAKVVPHDGLYR